VKLFSTQTTSSGTPSAILKQVQDRLSLLVEQRRKVLRGIGPFGLHDLFRRTFGNDLPAPHAAFGPEVDDPVGRLDHIEVVFDHHDRIALIDQAVEHFEEFADILKMQAGGRFIEDVERLPG